ncbi:hypothetical protein K1719_007886 [Acacia pycnantha]|nr:hypothetical protein K1719_007886 [Acacia pycnantha]
MNQKKLSLIGTPSNEANIISESPITNNNNRGIVMGSKSPQVKIQQMGSTLEVSVITGLDYHFIFGDFIRFLHDEQADVGECGDRAGRISERLRRFVYGSGAF